MLWLLLLLLEGVGAGAGVRVGVEGSSAGAGTVSDVASVVVVVVVVVVAASSCLGIGGKAVHIFAPHFSHAKSTDKAASFFLSSGGKSRAPIAPSPFVGIKLISATRTVRTD